MNLIDDLISILNYEKPVRDMRQGPFQTAVLTGNCGLASTPHDPGPHHKRDAVKEAGNLLGKDAKTLVEMVRSEMPLEAAIGMATMNSLLAIDQQRCVELNAGNLIAERATGKKVAIVGHFPFVSRLRDLAKELWVIEQKPQEGDIPEKEAANVIPQADVVGITGTAFTNHTIEQLLQYCSSQSYVVILGGTTPLSPVLFDYGIDAISGTMVIDSDVTLRCVSQGATFKQLRGIKLLTMLKDAKCRTF
jgi:uncharacterized protein (DUF4213/DUF364 family)